MTSTQFTLIEDGTAHAFDATIQGDAVRIASAPLLGALGWAQKPEGLCQGDVCIPIAGRPNLIEDGAIDLAQLAEVLGRPLALDVGESAASLAAASTDHGAELMGGIAPDFTLRDLSGEEHTLSDYRGKKVLLIAYASW